MQQHGDHQGVDERYNQNAPEKDEGAVQAAAGNTGHEAGLLLGFIVRQEK